MDRLNDTPPRPEYTLPLLDYNELINRLVIKNASFDYAIRLFHRSKLSTEESNTRLNASYQYARKNFPDTYMQQEADMKSEIRRRGVFNDTGMIFPEARAAMFLPPTGVDRDIQIKAFTKTMDHVTEYSNNLDPFKLSAWGYLHFVAIHPFRFGNGRVANEVPNFTLRKMGEKVSLPRPLFSKDKKSWRLVLSGIYSYLIGINEDNPGFYSSIEEKSKHDWSVMLRYCYQVKEMPNSRFEFPQNVLVSNLANMFRDCAVPLV